jgi:hypothetical protein
MKLYDQNFELAFKLSTQWWNTTWTMDGREQLENQVLSGLLVIFKGPIHSHNGG